MPAASDTSHYQRSGRSALQNVFENPKPIAAQNLFYVRVVESALYEFAGEIVRVRMVRQIRNKMRVCEFCGELFLPRFRPLRVDELEEVKTDPNGVDADQVYDVLDMIDVAIECAFFLSRAHKDRVDADDSAPVTDHLNLFVTNVALDIVIPAYVRVRHYWWLCCAGENLLEAGWIDVREINNYTKSLALKQQL